MEAHTLTPSELDLDNVELVRLNDGLVAFFNAILLDFALIDLLLFTEGINRIAFLEHTIKNDFSLNPLRHNDLGERLMPESEKQPLCCLLVLGFVSPSWICFACLIDDFKQFPAYNRRVVFLYQKSL